MVLQQSVHHTICSSRGPGAWGAGGEGGGRRCEAAAAAGGTQARADGLQPFGGSQDFRDEVCGRWLARLGMLGDLDVGGALDLGAPPPPPLGSDEEEEEACAACDQCGRSYPHEHVRAVRHAAYVDDGEQDDEGELAAAAPLIS